MTVALLNSCRFTAGTNGLADFDDGSAVVGFRNLAASGAVDGIVYAYRAESTDRSEWEQGLGTYESTGSVLQRTTILQSSNSDNKVNFTNPPVVFVTLLTEAQSALEDQALDKNWTVAVGALERSTRERRLGEVKLSDYCEADGVQEAAVEVQAMLADHSVVRIDREGGTHTGYRIDNPIDVASFKHVIGDGYPIVVTDENKPHVVIDARSAIRSSIVVRGLQLVHDHADAPTPGTPETGGVGQTTAQGIHVKCDPTLPNGTQRGMLGCTIEDIIVRKTYRAICIDDTPKIENAGDGVFANGQHANNTIRNIRVPSDTRYPYEAIRYMGATGFGQIIQLCQLRASRACIAIGDFESAGALISTGDTQILGNHCNIAARGIDVKGGSGAGVYNSKITAMGNQLDALVTDSFRIENLHEVVFINALQAGADATLTNIDFAKSIIGTETGMWIFGTFFAYALGARTFTNVTPGTAASSDRTIIAPTSSQTNAHLRLNGKGTSGVLELGAHLSSFFQVITTNSALALFRSINRGRLGSVDANDGWDIQMMRKSADPTTADLLSGQWGVFKNTTSGAVKLWVNDGGTMKGVALT